tara:strand:+ start:231 stop:2015 length:1785 start_codon:yes stop_codon:yes gene_type:complete
MTTSHCDILVKLLGSYRRHWMKKIIKIFKIIFRPETAVYRNCKKLFSYLKKIRHALEKRDFVVAADDAFNNRRWKTAKSLFDQIQNKYPEVSLDLDKRRIIEEKILLLKPLGDKAIAAMAEKRWKDAEILYQEIYDQYPELPEDQSLFVLNKVRIAKEQVFYSNEKRNELNAAIDKNWWLKSNDLLYEIKERYPEVIPSPDVSLLIEERLISGNGLLEIKDNLEIESEQTWEDLHLRNKNSARKRSSKKLLTTGVPKRLLFAARGHQDFIFLLPIIDYLKRSTEIEIRTLDISVLYSPPISEQKKGLTSYASELIDWADVVFVEWATAEAAWFIDLLPKSKKIALRLHSYELVNNFPLLIDWGKVDELICVSTHNLSRLTSVVDVESYGCKTHVLGNIFDFDQYFRPKKENASKTLGLVGYGKKVKRADLALELLETLLENDPTWKLHLIGDDPSDKREEDYFEDFFSRAESYIEQGIIKITPWKDDISSWLQEIGIILSCSDREGTHEACREGIASGCVGVIRKWPWAKDFGGNQTLFPNSFIWENVIDAAKYLNSFDSPKHFYEQASIEQNSLLKRESPEVLVDSFLEIVSS